MKSKLVRTGTVLLDNRVAPPEPGVPRFIEGDIFRCNHCERGVLKDPGHKHDGPYCWNCDSYLCAPCGVALKLTGKCEPYHAFLNRHATAVERSLVL
jgi:hypothetical protein